MAMYFDESLSQSQLRDSFAAARANNRRYLGVVEQVYADVYAVTVVQSVVSAHECSDIVRQVREQGLRPHAPQTRLIRLMDLSASFNAQLAMTGDAVITAAMTPDTQAAYTRYLAALQQKKDSAQATGTGLFARLFGKR